jgi:DNA-directed RNA polymerase specialized sigma24 family protein
MPYFPIVKHFLLSFLLIILSTNAHTQYENLLHKSFNEKRDLLVELYHNQLKVYAGDSAEVAVRIKKFEEFAVKHNDASLIREADYAAIMNKLWHDGGQLSPAVAEMEAFGEKCLEENDLVLACRAYRVFADYCWQDGKAFEQAFDGYFKLLEILPQLTLEKYIEKATDYISIANAYYYFRDYRKAIETLAPTLQYTFPKSLLKSKTVIADIVGLSYQKLGMLDSADYYFEIIRNNNGFEQFAQWYGIACGNLGFTAFLRKNFETAIPLLQTDIDTALKYGDYGLAAGSLIPLAEIRLNQNHTAEAELLAKKAREYIVTSKQSERYEYLYPLLSRLHLAKGNQQQAWAYLDSSLAMKDSVANRFSGLLLARAQERWQINHRKAAVALIEADKNKKTMQRNLLIVFALLLCIVAVFIYRLIRKRHQLDQNFKNLQLQQKETALRSATNQLRDFARNVSEKTQLLEKLEQRERQRDAEDDQIMENLRQSTILTDEQWEKFRTLFESVHGGYLYRLKEKIPNLTPAETRIITLAKLKFANKEMAATLGVSPQTVRVTWHRLRKKLNLPEEESLDELLDSI